MVAFQSFSQAAFLFLSIGLPVLAFVLGLYMKPGLLAAAFVGQLAIMIACLSMFYHLVETGKYPGYTGMEGIALVIFPAIYVTSLLISVIIYLVAAYVSRRRRGQ